MARDYEGRIRDDSRPCRQCAEVLVKDIDKAWSLMTETRVSNGLVRSHLGSRSDYEIMIQKAASSQS